MRINDIIKLGRVRFKIKQVSNVRNNTTIHSVIRERKENKEESQTVALLYFALLLGHSINSLRIL